MKRSLIFVIVFLLPVLLWSQHDTTEIKQLENVSVSSQKSEQRLTEAPVSLTYFTGKQIEDRTIRNIQSLTGYSPNLYVANPGDKRNITSIRGIINTSYDPAIATYVDGVNQFGLDTYIDQLFDIDHIEILRGPQGTLYGRNAMGGVINIYTKAPSAYFNSLVGLEYASFNTFRFITSVKSPLVKSKLYGGLVVQHDRTSGYYSNQFYNNHFDKHHSSVANGWLKYIINTNWQLGLNIKHVENRNNGAFPLVMGIDEALKNPFVLKQNDVSTMADNISNLSFTAKYTNDHIAFHSQTAFQHNYRYYKNEIDADFSPLDAISIFNNYGRNYNSNTVLTEELRLNSSRPNKKFKWLTGAYFFSQVNPVKQATRFGNDARLIGMQENNFSLISTSNAEASGLAFFGQVNYRLLKKLELFAGLRYDYEKRELSVLGEYQKDPDPNPQFAFRDDTSASIKFRSYSPRLGVSIYPSENSVVFLTYNKGYRPGGLTPLSFDPSQPPLFPYDPEQSHAFEMGYKFFAFEKRLNINSSIFYTNLRNVQVSTLVLPEAITIIKNTGSLNSKGFELEASWLIKDFRFDYSFGYTKARYTSLKISQNGSTTDLTGNWQVFTPELTSAFVVQYEKSRWKIHADWVLIGEHYFDLSNTIRQSPYDLLHLMISYRFNNLSIGAWGRNLLDEKFIQYGYDFGAVYLGNPCRFGIFLSWNYSGKNKIQLNSLNN
jgi:iron complex outermembrane recepter protein